MDPGCLLSQSPGPGWRPCDAGSLSVCLLLIFLLLIEETLVTNLHLFIFYNKKQYGFRNYLCKFLRIERYFRTDRAPSNLCLHNLLHGFSYLLNHPRRVNLGLQIKRVTWQAGSAWVRWRVFKWRRVDLGWRPDPGLQPTGLM